jgi:GNAT superfamily N-acetyltransferase
MTAEIEMLAPVAARDTELVAAATDLVNKVYGESEQGLWADSAARTTTEEVADFIQAGELAAAYLDGELVGIVRIQQLDAETGEFGMLAADPAVRGRGIGRDLIRYAEDTCRARGHRFMQLELLVPRHWKLASKEFLAQWYTRLDYRLERVGAIDEAYPHLAPLLATPADFRIYRKQL